MKLLVREQIKTLLAQEGVKLKDLAAMITSETGKNCAPNVLSRKLTRGTLSYNETLMIAELLGYDIIFQKKE
ncbi:MAG: LLM class flavin-dependent oxidoreductase [Cyanobacteria bacterium SIG28]|nr:LLM class flavin-dependent oxidoreductase [Cyanobacteria bacterium SIG28]